MYLTPFPPSLSDEGVCFSIQKGLAASRSKIKYFRHNDMAHLEQMLEEQRKLDKKVSKARLRQLFLFSCEKEELSLGEVVLLC